MNLKKLDFIYLITALVLILFLNIAANDTNENFVSSDFPQIYAQHEIERAGDELVEKGFYEEAIKKYREALDPKYIKREENKGSAIGRITRVLILLEKYDEALQEWQWYLDQSRKNAIRQGVPNSGEAELKVQEIHILKEYKKNRNSKIVYDYLKFYREKKFKSLPPSFEWGAGPAEISTILRLYDTIGDYDAGIKFIDECLEYFKQKDIKKYGEYRPGKADQEYLKIREAFEQDKAEGTKGRATKALIQSDYFPW